MNNQMAIEQLKELITSKEGEQLEFKKARKSFHFETLVKYCAALANEGGGKIVLGVTDKRPRSVVGSRAFKQPERTRSGLIEKLHLNIDFSILNHPNGRVLIFHVPTHPIGNPVKYKGIYWQRQGDSLVAMSEDRLRDIFAKCGLVERSGQGMNLMFELSIKESKPTPDFTGTDQYQVVLNLNGEVQDPHFLQFLEKVGQETLELFSTADFLLLDHIHRERRVPNHLQNRLQSLVEKGVVERFGRGRGVKYILSRRYYKMVDKKGTYTRKKGLDREENKALLLKHIKENRDSGSRLKELMQVLPALSDNQVKKVIAELKKEGKIYKIGATRAALWYPENKDSIVPIKEK